MKKILLFSLVLAIMLSMAACGCDHQWEAANCQNPKTCTLCGETEGETGDHTSGALEVTAVDTEALTITRSRACSICKAVLETQEASTGCAPVDGVFALSPDEWFACLTTNIHQHGATQTLIPLGAESEDNALVQGVVSLSGLKAAITFQDYEGNTLLTEQAEQRDLIHGICMDAHFTNDTASEFYMLLMLTVITNNSELTLDEANTLSAQIMSGNPAIDNGYEYQMMITSVEDQMVRLEISAL